ncbi:MAG: hypothetical protein PF542_06515 [Nanoarchaeota archaeon]|jgi:hypothetical protein|nr:hypothetical protein [Nanoarchaeota archaeon]
MTDEEYDVVAKMEKFGGSFVQALAVCFQRADPNNFMKLKITFHEYWEEFKEFNK